MMYAFLLQVKDRIANFSSPGSSLLLVNCVNFLNSRRLDSSANQSFFLSERRKRGGTSVGSFGLIPLRPTGTRLRTRLSYASRKNGEDLRARGRHDEKCN